MISSGSRSPGARGVASPTTRAPRCEVGFLDTGLRCSRPAAAYVEFHMVGHCQRFDCDANGNACGMVCAFHLDALAYTAQCTATELQPDGAGRPETRLARCPSCNRTIRRAADVLQAAVDL